MLTLLLYLRARPVLSMVWQGLGLGVGLRRDQDNSATRRWPLR